MSATRNPPPSLKLFNSFGVDLVEAQTPIYYYGHWIPEPDPAQIASRVGAFPLTPGAADVVRVVRLASGAYTAHVASATNQTGDILLEIYEVPDEALQDLFVPVPPPIGSIPTAPPSIPYEPRGSGL